MSIARLLNPNGKIASQFLPQTQAPILGAADPENIGDNEVGYVLQAALGAPGTYPIPDAQTSILEITLTPGVWSCTGSCTFFIPVASPPQYIQSAQCSIGYAKDNNDDPPYNALTQTSDTATGYESIAMSAPSQILTIPAGTTQQVWFTVQFGLTNSGTDQNVVRLTALMQAVRIA